MPDHPLLRSFLFAPGSDEHKMRKALSLDADAVVFDLEDSVVPSEKARAREMVRSVIEDVAESGVPEIHIRVNRLTDADDDDLEGVVLPGVDAIRLPKTESADEVRAAATRVGAFEAARGIAEGTIRLYPTIESAAAVLAAPEIAAAGPRVASLVFGPADFGASIGVQDPSFEATLLARSRLVLASAAAGVGPPVDGAFLDFGDSEGLRTLCERVRPLGFFGKSAIHPRQVPVINAAFTPSIDEVERAERVVRSSLESTEVGVVDGRFVDPPVVAQARAVLDLVRRIRSKGA